MMGECGCADYSPVFQYKLPDCVIGVEIYPGCDYCDTPLGLAMHFFKPDSFWVTDLCDSQEVVASDDSFEPGIPIFSVEDLRQAAQDLGGVIDPNGNDTYETMDDWLCDNGARLIRNALYICRKRCATSDDPPENVEVR